MHEHDPESGEDEQIAIDGGTETADTIKIPAIVEQICKEFDLEKPRPGETWKFTLENPPSDRDIGRELVGAGCELRMEMATGNGGRTYKYEVPTPGWPQPLGYITTDEPKFTPHQHGWRDEENFRGNVKGSIPDEGDCNRHPDLPENAYALTSVWIAGPSREPKFHAKPDLKVPEDAYTVNLTYKQVSNGRSLVEVYSSELGAFPDCTQWKSVQAGNRDERRRVEFFDTRKDAVQFIHVETGLLPPEPPEMDGRLVTDGGQNARPSNEVDRTADGMFRNYDEARNWVEDADLRSHPVVLEDHYNDEHVATCRVTGENDRYTLEITNHEGGDTTRTSVVDGTEVAEMMGGWKVAGRLDDKEAECYA